MSPSPASPDERALLRAWLEGGDEDAVAALWDANQRTAVAVASRLLRRAPVPAEEARDVADEAFLRALEAYDPARVRGRTERPFRALYLTIARNLAVDRARRLGREVPLDEADEPAQDPTAQLGDGIDVRAVLPRLRERILERYLPDDWALLERWMAYRRDGARVPWKTLAAEFPVTIDAHVAFAPGAAHPLDEAPVDAAARVLNACPQAHADVVGSRAPDEEPALAARRATVVARAVEQRLERRVSHDRRTGVSAPRLQVRVDEAGDQPGVHFEVTRGRLRSPDALRMRVEKVLLGHARALLHEEAP